METTTLKSIVWKLSQPLPLTTLRNMAPQVPLHLFYHTVSDKQLPYISSYQIKSIAQFEADLDALLRHYQPVDLVQITSERTSKQVFHLSFDDGLRECFEVIAPILVRKGIPATFFVNNGFVDNKTVFHRYLIAQLKQVGIIRPDEQFDFNTRHLLAQRMEDMNFNLERYLATESPYMTLNQIKQLQQMGFTIGAHSVSHPEFWKIGEEEQFQQIKQSMDWVTEHFNPQQKVFAFPFTDDGVSKALFERLHNEQVVDYTFGTAGYKPDIYTNHFQRIGLEQTRVKPALSILKFEYLYALFRQWGGYNQVKHA
jgi:peptidoglycan/xylan/chitin deacetylase (PgdA/CDA1 family)